MAFFQGAEAPCSLRKNDLAGQSGLVLETASFSYYSDYFSFCFPLHALWRIWQLLYRSIAGSQASETFSLVLRKTKAGEP